MARTFRRQQQKARICINEAVKDALYEIRLRSSQFSGCRFEREFIFDEVENIKLLVSDSIITEGEKEAILSEIETAATEAVSKAFPNHLTRLTANYKNIYV
jgi:hypothetical protein